MIRVFQHLLPRSRAWLITVDKNLRTFFSVLSKILLEDIREFFDITWTRMDPQKTDELKRWERQFGLVDTGLTEQQRRDRLEAAWASVGGQSPRYIQDTLQANGFPVYVHEWWVPGTEPAVGVVGAPTVRNPLTYLKQTYPGDTTPDGYPLVNKIFETSNNWINQAGEVVMQAGEALAVAGSYDGFAETTKSYTVPASSDYWPYFIYIGGETFGTLADVPSTRREEFEALCLKICPCHLWLGMLINYT